jgi:hypothetical protein
LNDGQSFEELKNLTISQRGPRGVYRDASQTKEQKLVKGWKAEETENYSLHDEVDPAVRIGRQIEAIRARCTILFPPTSRSRRHVVRVCKDRHQYMA